MIGKQKNNGSNSSLSNGYNDSINSNNRTNSNDNRSNANLYNSSISRINSENGTKVLSAFENYEFFGQSDSTFMNSLPYNRNMSSIIPVTPAIQDYCHSATEDLIIKRSSSSNINLINSLDRQQDYSDLLDVNSVDNYMGEDGDSGDDDLDSLANDDDMQNRKRKLLSGTNDGGMHDDDGNLNVVDERAKEKNRYHAKNTRIRKKNYIESLKDRLVELCHERELTFDMRKDAVKLLAAKVEQRIKNLESFFFYRCNGEVSRKLWEGIVDDDICLTLPVTPYRSFDPSQLINNQRKAVGISAVIEESCSFYMMVQSIGISGRHCEEIRTTHQIDSTRTITSGDDMMCKWSIFSVNAVKNGSRKEIVKSGMLEATFNSSNDKIKAITLVFDVMGFMQELRQESGNYDFKLTPNTLIEAYNNKTDANLIIDANYPYTITFVNQSWQDAFGYSCSSNIVGKNLLSIIQYDDSLVSVIKAIVSLRRASLVNFGVFNHDKVLMHQHVKFFPLYEKNVMSHMLLSMVSIHHMSIPSMNTKVNNYQRSTVIEEHDDNALPLMDNEKFNHQGNSNTYTDYASV